MRIILKLLISTIPRKDKLNITEEFELKKFRCRTITMANYKFLLYQKKNNFK